MTGLSDEGRLGSRALTCRWAVMMPPTPRNMPGPEKVHSVMQNGLEGMRVYAHATGGRCLEKTGFVFGQRDGRPCP